MILDFRFWILDSPRRGAGKIAAVLALALCSGAPAEPATQSKIQDPKSKIAAPFLWKIEGAGPKPSWLFGTIHLPRPDVTRIPPVVQAAADHADAVYTEISADPPTLLALVPKMMLPAGGTIDQALGPKLTAELQQEVRSINPAFDLQAFWRFKPWAVVASVLQLEDQMKYPGTLALDMLLFQRAAMAGQEVGGIETADEQVALFDAFSHDEQVLMVEDTLRQLRELRASRGSFSDFLAGLYLAGDLDRLMVELEKLDSVAGHPELSEKFLDRLLYRRNALMAERITARLHDHPDTSYFFAVGAAHLHGPRGLVAALEKAGFQVSRAP